MLALLWQHSAAAQYASPSLSCPSCDCQRATEELKLVSIGIKETRRDLSTLGPTSMMTAGGAMTGALLLASMVRLGMLSEEGGEGGYDRFQGHPGRFWAAVTPLLVINVGLLVGGAQWRHSLLQERKEERAELAWHERRLEIILFKKEQCRGPR